MDPQRALWGRLLEHPFSMSFFNRFWYPPQVLKRGTGGMGDAPSGGSIKHHFGSKSVKTLRENVISAKLCLPSPAERGIIKGLGLPGVDLTP